VVAALAALVTSGWGPLTDLDRSVSNALVVPGHGQTVDALRVVSDAASGPVRAVLAAAAAIWFMTARRPAVALFVALSAVATAAIVQWMKIVIDRPRPGLPDTGVFAGYSFPSGHSAGSAMMATTLVVLLGAVVSRRAARRAAPYAIGFAGLIGYTRIALGAHFLTDVVAGWLVGGTVVLLTAAACGVLPLRRRNDPDEETR
jgi:undecaprenyl-diphosphatase